MSLAPRNTRIRPPLIAAVITLLMGLLGFSFVFVSGTAQADDKCPSAFLVSGTPSDSAGGMGIHFRTECGETDKALTSPPATAADTDAELTPDGKSASFTRTKYDVSDIYTVPLKGDVDPQLLPGVPGHRRSLTWSPNGDKFAYESTGETKGVYTSDANGNNIELLVADATNPAWSPNGDWLAVTLGEQIWIVKSDHAGKPKQITHDGCSKDHSAWSPDSNWIFFGATGNCVVPNQIHRVPLHQPQGTQPIALTSLDGKNYMPAVSQAWELIFIHEDPKGSRRVAYQPLTGSDASILPDGGTTKEQGPSFGFNPDEPVGKSPYDDDPNSTSTPEVTATSPSPDPSETVIPEPTNTESPQPTLTATITSSPTPEVTSSPTLTDEPPTTAPTTAMPTVMPTEPTPDPTVSEQPQPTVTPTLSPTLSATPTVTPTPTVTSTSAARISAPIITDVRILRSKSDPPLRRGIKFRTSGTVDAIKYAWGTKPTAKKRGTIQSCQTHTKCWLNYRDVRPGTTWLLHARTVKNGVKSAWKSWSVKIPKTPKIVVIGDGVLAGYHAGDCHDSNYSSGYAIWKQSQQQLPSRWRSSGSYANFAQTGLTLRQIRFGGTDACGTRQSSPLAKAVTSLKASPSSWNRVVVNGGLTSTKWPAVLKTITDSQKAHKLTVRKCNALIARWDILTSASVRKAVATDARYLAQHLATVSPLAKRQWIGYYNPASTGKMPSACKAAMTKGIATLNQVIKQAVAPSGFTWVETSSIIGSNKTYIQSPTKNWAYLTQLGQTAVGKHIAGSPS